MPKVNGPLIRRARRGLGLRTEDLAPPAGITPGALRNIENMRAVASDDVISRLAMLLRLAEDDVRSVPRVLQQRAEAEAEDAA